MSREIKYRIWDGESMSYMEDYNSWGHFWDTADQSYDGTELMQFTGLKDKNGKEIYEGDVVKSRRTMYSDDIHDIRHVYFAEGCFLIGAVTLHIVTMDSSFAPEVIGNIHENPELLK